MGLIDKNTILELCNKSGEGVVAYYDVEKLPEIDAEIVTRCKDCENWSYQECVADNICWCNKLEKFTWKNFYCADGERRGGND